MSLSVTDPEYKAEVEAQVVTLKSAANEIQKQEAAQRLWTLAESGNREEEVARQSFVIKEGAAKPLIQLLKTGNEESKWRAARALVQIAFANEETSAVLAKLKAIKTTAESLRDLDGCTDRIKESSLQLLNNIASNCWTSHKAVIDSSVLGHVIVILRSITIPEAVKRAAVNLVFSLTFTEDGRNALLDIDVVSSLVPIIRANKTSVNSMCATLAVANLIGHRVRAQMIQGCGVVEKVLKALEHSLNREPMGGHYHSLWKVVLAFMELCKSDTHKDTLVKANGIALLSRLMDLSPDRQNDRNLVYGCTAVWHLAFNGQGKALLCEEALLCERIEAIALADDHVAMQEARGALFQLGIIPKPPYADAMTHVFLSFDSVIQSRVEQIGALLEKRQYVVWIQPPTGKIDENFRNGVANCAALCVCLSANYHLSCKARTEITFAQECSKQIFILTVDDEGRERCWLQPFIEGRTAVDFTNEANDADAIDELIDVLGNRGKKVQRRASTVAVSSPTVSSPTTTSPLAAAKHGANYLGDADPTISPNVPAGAGSGTPAQADAESAKGNDSPAQLGSREASQSSLGRQAEQQPGSASPGLSKLPDEGVHDGKRPGTSRQDASARRARGGDDASRRQTPAANADDEGLLSWSIDQVAEWVDKVLVLGQYKETFIARSVDGFILASLDDTQLEEKLLISSRLHRKKILTRVARMQEQS